MIGNSERASNHLAGKGLLLFALLPLALALAGRAWGGAAEVAGVEEIKDVTIVVAGEPYTGNLVPPPTEGEFRFRWNETGDILTFRWSTLEEPERKRVQKLFKIEVDEGTGGVVWGEKVKCVRLKLVNRKTLEGQDRPMQALPGHRCLKNATQVVQVPLGDIEAEETIEKRESEILTPEEGLQELLLRKPPKPDSAADHLELARECSNRALYDRAIDYLEMAKTIDARTEERTKEFRQELLTKHEEQQAGKMWLQILAAVQRQDNGSALEKCQTFLRNFPNSERKTKIESLMPDLTKGTETDKAKMVIFMYYNLFPDMIQARIAKKNKVDEQNRPVPAEPGKQITTRKNNIIRGKLKSEGAEFVEVESGDVTYKVPRAEILTIVDVDLAKAHHQSEPTFTELKTYVTDADNGLGKDILAKISETLRMDPEKVKEIWDGRFAQVAVLQPDGSLQKTPTYVSMHQACYDKGSWLREGAMIQPTKNAQPKADNFRVNARGEVVDKTQQDKELAKRFPELSEEPDVWWTVQRSDTKSVILRAIGAEKLFRVREVKGRACPECASKGAIVTNNNAGYMICPYCRGLKLLYLVLYE